MAPIRIRTRTRRALGLTWPPWAVVICALIAMAVIALAVFALTLRRSPMAPATSPEAAEPNADVARLLARVDDLESRLRMQQRQLQQPQPQAGAAAQRPVSVVAIDSNAIGPPGVLPQVGYIRGSEEEQALLPLYGAPSEVRRHRWHYYTIAPAAGGQSIKVPVVNTGRDCMEEVGCDELADGDRVQVPDRQQGTGEVRLYKPRIML